jgi:hypothetical protein
MTNKETNAIEAAIRHLRPDGGWNNETIGGWPDVMTRRGLQLAVDAGQVEHRAACGSEGWRLTAKGVARRRSLS